MNGDVYIWYKKYAKQRCLILHTKTSCLYLLYSSLHTHTHICMYVCMYMCRCRDSIEEPWYEWQFQWQKQHVGGFYWRSLIQVAVPMAAATCQAACRYGVSGKTSSAMKKAHPTKDEIVCKVWALLSCGSASALLANVTFTKNKMRETSLTGLKNKSSSWILEHQDFLKQNAP